MRRSFLFYPVLSGILLGVGFLMPFLWWVSCAGLIPFLSQANRAPSSMRNSFAQGWLLGFIVSVFALYGIFWHTLPIDWFGISSWGMQIAVVGGSWIFAAAALGLGTGVFGVLVRRVQADSFADIFTVPALWVLCEVLGSFIGSIIFAGPGSLIGAHFTLPYLGYLLANDIVLLQAAWLGGVYALSFIVIAANLLIYRMWVAAPGERRLLCGISAGLACIFLLGHASFNSAAREEGEDGSVRVAAVSTYVPISLQNTLEEERRNAEEVGALMREALTNADMVVLPEGAHFLSRSSDAPLGSLPLLIDSGDSMQGGGFRSSRALFRYPDDSLGGSEKQLPLPLGEYVPYLYRAFLALAPAEFRAHVLETRADVSGTLREFARISGASAAVRFCNETMSPFFYASDTRGGAGLLVNLSSQAWYHESRLVHQQMQNVAKVRAVESGRWYVQSANMAPAFALDSHGRVAHETEWGIPQALSVRVPIHNERTPYVVAGMWAPLLLALILGALSTKRWRAVINRTLY